MGAIYKPKNKASEYAPWACNFYNGCSNGCEYCYCKKGILANTMGGDKPTLKKCFKDEAHALELFEKELLQNVAELQKYGLFFSFSTDPMLPETIKLTCDAVDVCVKNSVNVKILTKVHDFVPFFFERLTSPSSINEQILHIAYTAHVAFGFTLTGHDELEPNASKNSKRIETMKILHDGGYKTFASIEPIITLPSALDMIERSVNYCDLYKIGLESGKKYDKDNLNRFMYAVISGTESMGCKVYFKDSLLKQADMSRANLPNNCVTRDYNLFK